jgi:hypothetical protein
VRDAQRGGRGVPLQQPADQGALLVVLEPKLAAVGGVLFGEECQQEVKLGRRRRPARQIDRPAEPPVHVTRR